QGTLMQQGLLDARRIRIEDQTGGAGSTDMVRIQGIVLSVGATDFHVRLRQVGDGKIPAGPIIDLLVDPRVIDVSFDGSTVFLLGDTGVATSAALEVGRDVDVRFCTFALTPFPACEVDVS